MNGRFLFGVAGVLAMAAIQAWTSRMNSAFFFGRTVNALVRHSDEARAITRRYLTQIWLSVAPCVLVALVAWRWQSKLLLFAALFLIVALGQMAFARANGAVKKMLGEPFPQEGHVVEVALLPAEAEEASWWVPSLITVLLPLAAGALVCVAGVVGAGRGAWRTGLSVLNVRLDTPGNSFLLGFALALVVTGAMLLMLFRSSARLRTNMAQYTMRTSLALSWVGVAALGVLLAFVLRGTAISMLTARAVTFSFLGIAVGLQIWNLARSKKFVPAAVEMHGDDRWRWGLYYWNPADPALFVQRRTGMGFTLNFARGWAWAISTGIVAYFAAMIVLKAHR